MSTLQSKRSFIRDLYMTPTEKTFQYDESLPALPVPDLHQTLQKYMKSIEPFVTSEQYDNTKRIVKEFESGIGAYLQVKLLARATVTKNWLHDWWLKYAYLQFRLPISPLSNMAGPQSLNLTIWKPDEDQMFERMALNVHVLLDFFHNLREERLRVHESRKGEKLSMNQFRMIFSSNREPHKDEDKLSTYFRTKAEGFCPKHLIVMCNGHVWILTPWHSDDEWYSVPELEKQLRYIERESKALGKGQEIGTLTVDYRDSWAKNRDLLISLSEQNSQNLYLIESSIMTISFDENSPKDFSEFCKLSLCGDPTNRWADKSYGGIFFKNGFQSSNHDHTPSDAMAGVVLGLYQHEIITEEFEGKWTGSKTVERKLFEPQRLTFELNDSLKSSIEQIKILNKNLNDSIDVKFRTFTDFGKKFIREHNLHPDSFAQCALQLGYYLLHNKCAPTYETATTRQFYKGRTETVRSCSTEMVDFVLAFSSKTLTMSEKKTKLLRAIQNQVALMNECRSGHGIDRHLMGLSLIALEKGLPELELTKDISYKLSGGGGNYVLSTSTTGNTHGVGGVVPMVQDGYGVFYSFSPVANSIYFYISAYVAGDTDIDEFYNSVSRALTSMRLVLDSPTSQL